MIHCWLEGKWWMLVNRVLFSHIYIINNFSLTKEMKREEKVKKPTFLRRTSNTLCVTVTSDSFDYLPMSVWRMKKGFLFSPFITNHIMSHHIVIVTDSVTVSKLHCLPMYKQRRTSISHHIQNENALTHSALVVLFCTSAALSSGELPQQNSALVTQQCVISHCGWASITIKYIK